MRLMVAMAVATISEVYGELQRAAGATERLLELLAEEAEICMRQKTPFHWLTDGALSLRFDDVRLQLPFAARANRLKAHFF